MPIKDSLTSWFLRKVIMPRVETIDKPGFITIQMKERDYNVFLRENLISENLLTEIENKLIKEYGEKGKQVLYSTGKKFGYRFAQTLNFPKISTANEKKFLDFTYNVTRYLECIYSSKINHFIELKDKKFKLELFDYVVCRLNGYGNVLTVGGPAGVWAFAVNDKKVEGVQIKCQGNGSKNCEVICAPPEELNKLKLNYLLEQDLGGLELEKNYHILNKQLPIKNAKYSFKTLLDNGFFRYRGGFIQYKNERFCLMESSLIYLFEEELKKLEKSEDLVFNTSFEYGKKLAKTNKSVEFLINFLPACGFGDLFMTIKDKKQVFICEHYPWTKYADKSRFIIYRGLISGLASEILNREIKLKRFKTNYPNGFLSLIMTE